MNLFSKKLQALFEKANFKNLSIEVKAGTAEVVIVPSEGITSMSAFISLGFQSTIAFILSKRTNGIDLIITERFEKGMFGSHEYISTASSLQFQEAEILEFISMKKDMPLRDINAAKLFIDIVNNLYSFLYNSPLQKVEKETQDAIKELNEPGNSKAEPENK